MADYSLHEDSSVGCCTRFSVLLKKNKKNVALIVIAVAFIILGIFGVVFLRPKPSNIAALDLNSILNGTFADKSVSPSWDSNGKFYYIYRNNSQEFIHMIDPTVSLDPVVIASPEELKVDDDPFKITSWKMSEDGKFFLLATNIKKLWRHSYEAEYIIYDATAKKSVRLLSKGTRVRNAVISPDGKSIAYVSEGNIFIKDRENLGGSPIQVVPDTDIEESILYGVMSWVYEEEIFSGSTALWWSPDGSKLAYLKSNETEVNKLTIPRYGHDSDNGIFVDNLEYRYPTPGTKNPEVSVLVFDVATATNVEVDIYSHSTFKVEYVTEILWGSTSSSLIVRVLNRDQNREYLAYSDTETGDISTWYLLSTVAKGWIEKHPLVKYNSTHLYTIMEHEGNFHIFAVIEGSSQKPITSGKFDILTIDGFDTSRNLLYYTSTEPSAVEQHLYSINVNTLTDIKRLTEGEGFYASSIGKDHVVLSNKGPSRPVQYIAHKKNVTDVQLLVNNTHIDTNMGAYHVPTKEFFTITVNDRELNAFIIKPPKFSANSQYAALFTLYGGPGSITVSKTFTMGFNEFVSSSLDIVVIAIDNVGTRGNGTDFLKKTYLNLGIEETKDQIEGIKEVLKQNSFIDKKRVALWGWSFGGFMTLNVALRGEGLLQSAVAVAPVTDWRYYDSVYTERYMKTPQNNLDGYKNTSLVELVQNNATALNSTELLLIHGIFDDNVRLDHAAILSEVMVKQKIQFQQFYYTNQDHGINADGARYHIYEKIQGFLKTNLAGQNHS